MLFLHFHNYKLGATGSMDSKVWDRSSKHAAARSKAPSSCPLKANVTSGRSVAPPPKPHTPKLPWRGQEVGGGGQIDLSTLSCQQPSGHNLTWVWRLYPPHSFWGGEGVGGAGHGVSAAKYSGSPVKMDLPSSATVKRHA